MKKNEDFCLWCSQNCALELALHSSGLNQRKKRYRDEMSGLMEQDQQLLRQENERLQAELHSIKEDLVKSREKVMKVYFGEKNNCHISTLFPLLLSYILKMALPEWQLVATAPLVYLLNILFVCIVSFLFFPLLLVSIAVETNPDVLSVDFYPATKMGNGVLFSF